MEVLGIDCLYPKWVLKDSNAEDKRYAPRILVPCGHCIVCRVKKTKEWTLRLLMEDKNFDKSSFVTLTYDDYHLPTLPCGKNPLLKSELQLFFKRLRKRLDYKIKYYACGEYGDQFKRPHFHIILFGVGFDDDDIKLLNQAWQYKGRIDVQPVTSANIGYVCGYVSKKLYYDKLDEFKEFGCLPSPFHIQSQGLGLDYYNEISEQLLDNPHLKYKGSNCSIPRYFLSKDDLLKSALDNARQVISDYAFKTGDYSNLDVYDKKSSVQTNKNLQAKYNLRKRKF